MTRHGDTFHRSGNTPLSRSRAQAAGPAVAEYRDRVARMAETRNQVLVLAGARIRPGDTVATLGADDRQLAAEAVRRAGPTGRVVTVDVPAQPLATLPVAALRAVSESVEVPLEDGAADVVISRSPATYLTDLQGVLREGARVLRPGGRLSACQPVHARRRYHVRLHGLAPRELAALGARARAGAAEVFAAERLSAAAESAGLLTESSAFEDTVRQLHGVAEVEAHLRLRDSGALTLLEHATAALGTRGAQRYLDAWLDAAREHGTIAYTTPVVYATFRKPEPRQDG
ncbi:methyltransferase domain-containing protein [Streptomyces noursei]|uniref:methyltransferase domain-containing protein n=1 Tax=Streptomyces noursei TaxID=1971 RepID=UPI00081D20FE|nr:methyltransferase family protein [Streptomyces noursei ATCC 11455]MCZ0994867.1 methyltransferase domain-containing protein [Streptomyces noursei]